MTHLPYIVAAYSLGVLIPSGFAVTALLRMQAAKRRLAAIDTRRSAGRTSGSRRAQ